MPPFLGRRGAQARERGSDLLPREAGCKTCLPAAYLYALTTDHQLSWVAFREQEGSSRGFAAHAVPLISKDAQLWHLQHLGRYRVDNGVIQGYLEMGWWGDTGPSLRTCLQPGILMLQSTAFIHGIWCAQWGGTPQALSL